MSNATPIEPRPRRLTPDDFLRVAKMVAERLIDSGLTRGAAADSIAKDIHAAAGGRPYVDGYDLAKTLDDEHGWNCDFQIAEQLDLFRQFVAEVLHLAECQWAARNKIEPPFATGTRVAFGPDGETGVITSICAHNIASFSVAVDGDALAGPPHNRRRILFFEDVREAVETSPAQISNSGASAP